MTATLVYGLAGSVLVGVGLYGFAVRRHLLRQILAFNIIGSGLFLLFGALARRTPDGTSDPVPQAMIITGIVVAFAATALAEALAERYQELTGRTALEEDSKPAPPDEQESELRG
ncbi:NADH-quinone oxidoreductase subunit K [Erythrobacteraceae bacterium CFH 75059]|uniref:NADH-quinone oxidoreductase subunit K n=1 Tax=Qipengyuania thermophila TaxID=2509361 RepID=UPI001020A552|nr:NADH-quinone oxidoreductase subunit K [Qipengyuania thermophila]TCD06777.1 NADH-quinone oxidoreductase subunit K [Erythrobacteraceae bacterium CFH 75059]